MIFANFHNLVMLPGIRQRAFLADNVEVVAKIWKRAKMTMQRRRRSILLSMTCNPADLKLNMFKI